MQMDIFMILTLIVIIILVLTSKDMTGAIILIVLMMNCFLLYREWGCDKQDMHENMTDMPMVPEDEYLEPTQSMYGDEQELYDTYINSYGDSHNTNSPIAINSASERDYSVDNATVDLSIRRFRDKKAADGRTVKDADFYKHHFANELDEEEKKRWWGNGEW